MNKGAIIFGATSSIGKALCDQLAAEGYDLFLAGRDRDDLDIMATDLFIRHNIKVVTAKFDADKPQELPKFVHNSIAHLEDCSIAMLCLGSLGKQEDGETRFEEAAVTINRNFTAAAAILMETANAFIEKKSGTIVALSSVAGDRGRQSNYIYGAAKGGLNVYLQGLRNRLASHNVHVITVKPGFIDTAMTYGLPGMFMVAEPRAVAKSIIEAINRRRNIVYVPWFWKWIMLAIKLIPEGLFKKLRL